jgi:hypothetical protein
MKNDVVGALIALAEVPIERQSEAREWLTFWLGSANGVSSGKSRARSTFEAATQRGVPADHNERLIAVERAAVQLEGVLLDLRKRGYAHSDFWMNEVFGKIRGGAVESAGLFRMLTAIRTAARAAKVKRVGRPPAAENLRLVKLAHDFYSEYSPRRPTATISKTERGFLLFAARFYTAVTGASVNPEHLLRPVRSVLRKTATKPNNKK